MIVAQFRWKYLFLSRVSKTACDQPTCQALIDGAAGDHIHINCSFLQTIKISSIKPIFTRCGITMACVSMTIGTFFISTHRCINSRHFYPNWHREKFCNAFPERLHCVKCPFTVVWLDEIDASAMHVDGLTRKLLVQKSNFFHRDFVHSAVVNVINLNKSNGSIHSICALAATHLHRLV